MQSIATSRIESEKFLIIGADDKSRTFHAVDNHADFDEASVRQLLERYLSPTPAFEVFQLNSSAGLRFVLIVVPKQRQRRILAKVTVHSDDGKQRLLLREGDLWTKGSSTGKRLAKAEDSDEIIEDIIEAEAERRARSRTIHMVELALAREKVKPAEKSLLPSVFSDNDFQALMEEVCGRKDMATFSILLERLRDDLVEGWNSINAFEPFHPMTPDSPSKILAHVRDHITNFFRPAMHWVTMAGVFVVKAKGPSSFLDAVVDLLSEVFETTYRLSLLRSLAAQGQWTKSLDEHISHTVPALESLITLHLIGAYVAKRQRFEYFRSLLRADVFHTLWDRGSQSIKRPMAFWPIDVSYGEPEELGKWGGRLRLCASRAMNDSALRKLFGTENATLEALSQYEFCLELNSFVSFPEFSKATAALVKQLHPDTAFQFYPAFFAFPLAFIHGIASAILQETKTGKARLLGEILFDRDVVSIVMTTRSTVFADFLYNVAKEHVAAFQAQQRFTPISSAWPKDISDELKRIVEVKKQAATE